jgi:serine/threonine protein kinase
MTPQRWQQVKQITADALERDPDTRASFVESASSGDEELRNLVLRLVSDCESAEPDFLTENTWNARSVLDSPPPASSFAPGQVLAGRFEIKRFLSSGGMGEVYEAWDAELRENVALKTIRPEIAADPRVIESFKHEVKQARRIAHRNICRVYDLFCHEESDSRKTWFLTMELLAGRTLLEQVRESGPLDAGAALDLIEQMADGLAAAHEMGIVHKDFKSGNVMLMDSAAGQRAVIMDFGLAVNLSSSAGAGSAGVGTPDYMAPEQRGGGTVGFAADQYAFGVVIYEMRTGKRPPRGAAGEFAGKAEGGPQLESRWQAVVRRCLAVRPEDRFSSVGEIVPALDPRRPRGASRQSRRWRLATAALLAVAAVGAILFAVTSDRPDRLEGLAQLTSGQDLSKDPSFNRDGTMAAYDSDRAEPGNRDIWVQSLPSGTARRLTTNAAEDSYPSLSPDGTTVVFHSERNDPGAYLVDTNTGRERLFAAEGRDPRFSPDGRRIAYWVGDKNPDVSSGHLYVAPVDGGPPQRLAVDFKDARQPAWSGDGRYILFSGCRQTDQPMPGCAEWWVTGADGKVVNTGALASVRALGIVVNESMGYWQGDRVIFSATRGSARGLWEIKISPRTMQVTGIPRPLTSGDDNDYDPTFAAGGHIAFGKVLFSLHIWRIPNGLSGAAGNPDKATGDAEADYCPFISPNGRWLVFPRVGRTGIGIWVKDVVSGQAKRVLDSAFRKYFSLIDDSGETIVFEQRDREVPSIFVIKQGGAPRLLCSECTAPTGWFRGTREVLYSTGLPSRVMAIDVNTGERRELLEKPGTSLTDANWSAANQFLVFTVTSPDGLSKQVLAVRLADSTGMPAGPWIAITPEAEWSERPRWSGDGRTIFYLSRRDGFSCVWARHFDTQRQVPMGPEFAVAHYHNQRFSPDQVIPRSFNLAVAGDSVYLNPAEVTETLWTGALRTPGLFDWPR